MLRGGLYNEFMVDEEAEFEGYHAEGSEVSFDDILKNLRSSPLLKELVWRIDDHLFPLSGQHVVSLLKSCPPTGVAVIPQLVMDMSYGHVSHPIQMLRQKERSELGYAKLRTNSLALCGPASSNYWVIQEEVEGDSSEEADEEAGVASLMSAILEADSDTRLRSLELHCRPLASPTVLQTVAEAVVSAGMTTLRLVGCGLQNNALPKLAWLVSHAPALTDLCISNWSVAIITDDDVSHGQVVVR